MQRKLVSFDVFETIEKNSLTNAAKELAEATDIFGKSLGVDLDRIYCFDSNSVVYESTDGNFVKATYNLNDKNIQFTNIEELVVDVDSETDARKANISEMVDALTSNEDAKADLAWDKIKVMLERVMKRGRAKKSMMDMQDDNFKKAGKEMCEASGMVFVRHGAKDVKRAMAAKRGWTKRRPKEGSIRAKTRSRLEQLRSNRKNKGAIKNKVKSLKGGVGFARAYFTRGGKGKKVNEWTMVLDNFYNYLNETTCETGEVIRGNSGEVLSVNVPVKNVRLEGKVIDLKLDVLTAKIKMLREQNGKIVSSPEFAKAITQLKRCNGISDQEALEETLTNIVGKWSSLIAMTESELSTAIGNALRFTGEKNWDDQTCEWLAESVLRTATEAFPERIETILNLSDTKPSGNEDSYLDYQSRVEGFFAQMDETRLKELELVESIYANLTDVAPELDDGTVKNDVVSLINELGAMLDGHSSLDMSVAESAAEYLVMILEALDIDGENTWSAKEEDINGAPETSANGEVNQNDVWSNFSYKPSEINKFKNSPQIKADSMDIKNGVDKNGFGVYNSADTWDGDSETGGLHNPYLLKNLKFDAPNGETDTVDSSDAFGVTDVAGKTWPSLENPALLKNMTKVARPDMGQKDKFGK